MRIGLSCTSIEPVIYQNKIDGIGTYTSFLLDAYRQHANVVIPVSFSKNGLTQSHYQDGLVFPYSYIASTLASIVNFSPFSLHANIENKIDLLHITDHLIPQLKKTPVIATVHDAEMFKSHDWIKNQYSQRLKSWGRKQSLKWVKHFITISKAMVPELVEDCGIPEEKITVIHNGISPWWFEKITEEDKQQVLNKFSIPQQFVLFTGTLNYRKNLARLVNAYLKLPTDVKNAYPLIVVGKAGWDSDESAQAVQKLKDNQAGFWLDYIANDELRVLFQSASLYAHPSLHEGFGLTILQAFASGTPVLTSNRAAMPEVAGDAALLVDPESEISIREGMLKLLTNKTLCDSLTIKGEERVKDFSWEKTAKETLAVYKEMTC